MFRHSFPRSQVTPVGGAVTDYLVISGILVGLDRREHGVLMVYLAWTDYVVLVEIRVNPEAWEVTPASSWPCKHFIYPSYSKTSPVGTCAYMQN